MINGIEKLCGPGCFGPEPLHFFERNHATMKKVFLLFLAFCLALGGCAAQPGDPSAASAPGRSNASTAVSVTDSEGGTVSVPAGDPQVVCLYGSYADAWLMAGGSLAGVTEDAVEERQLDVGKAKIVGTVKEPNAEEIIALDPDWVILSSDIASHEGIKDVLENAGIACSSFRVDTFEDYAFLMKQFCQITGQEDLAADLVERVSAQISDVVGKAKTSGLSPSVLLIRAFSSGIKAKTDDELAGAILKDLGAHNIADDHPSMLEDLSLEEVIQADPDYIFVTTMGSEKKALDYLNGLIEKNPAWQELSAVKEGRYVVLPKELFHYKPNSRWGESYEYLAKILYPSLFE